MKARDAHQKAIELEESGDLAGALEIWQRLAQKHSKAEFYCSVGRILQSLERYSEAEEAFRSARKIKPDLAIASISLAMVFLRECKCSEALEVLDSTLEQEASALAYDLRGGALQRLERWDEALQSYRKAIALDPTYEEAFFNIGWLLRNSDREEAQMAFEKAIELDGRYAPAYRELGWIFRKKKQLDLAEENLRKAIEFNPSDSWASVYLGNTLWAKGEFSAAENAFKRAESLAPEEWYPNWFLAAFYEDGEDYARSARFYHKALIASKDVNIVLFTYGRFLLRQGDRSGAEKYLRRAIEIDPSYEEAILLLRAIEAGKGP